jgi:hypothetical protein
VSRYGARWPPAAKLREPRFENPWNHNSRPDYLELPRHAQQFKASGS